MRLQLKASIHVALDRALEEQIEALLQWTLKNKSSLISILKRAYGETLLEEHIREKSPMPEFADLATPLIVQRIQDTLTNFTFKQQMQRLLQSAPARKLLEKEEKK